MKKILILLSVFSVVQVQAQAMVLDVRDQFVQFQEDLKDEIGSVQSPGELTDLFNGLLTDNNLDTVWLNFVDANGNLNTDDEGDLANYSYWINRYFTIIDDIIGMLSVENAPIGLEMEYLSCQNILGAIRSQLNSARGKAYARAMVLSYQ